MASIEDLYRRKIETLNASVAAQTELGAYRDRLLAPDGIDVTEELFAEETRLEAAVRRTQDEYDRAEAEYQAARQAERR